jgi:hypothetical protein
VAPVRWVTRPASPACHRVTPKGYLEGFATIYAEAARAIRAKTGRPGTPDPAVIFPTIEDGLAGVKFIEAAVSSSASNGAWVRIT